MAATASLEGSPAHHVTSAVAAGKKLTFGQVLQRNRKRFCGFVAPWFTTSQFVIKTTELVLSTISIVLLFVWESNGVKITTLNQHEYNYRNYLFYFVGVVCISILYAVTMTTLGFAGVRLPSKALTFFAALCVLLWLLANPILSSTLDTLEDSVFGRRKDLNILYLRVVSVFGFILLLIFVIDILLGFMGMRESDMKSLSSGEEDSEMKNSRSVIAAIKLTTRQQSSDRRWSFYDRT